MGAKKIHISIEDFEVSKGEDGLEYISWGEIEKVLGKRKYKKFIEFMNGQTCIEQGVYTCDVENFLRPIKKQFFD